MLYVGQSVSAGGVTAEVVGGETVALPPYVGGRLPEELDADVTLPYGGGELLDGAGLAVLCPYGGGELFESEGETLLLP